MLMSPSTSSATAIGPEGSMREGFHTFSYVLMMGRSMLMILPFTRSSIMLASFGSPTSAQILSLTWHMSGPSKQLEEYGFLVMDPRMYSSWLRALRRISRHSFCCGFTTLHIWSRMKIDVRLSRCFCASARAYAFMMELMSSCSDSDEKIFFVAWRRLVAHLSESLLRCTTRLRTWRKALRTDCERWSFRNWRQIAGVSRNSTSIFVSPRSVVISYCSVMKEFSTETIASICLDTCSTRTGRMPRTTR
mmetsp:Transcript_35153/g.59566  ORF Transcript_35153/g.59566 Transcript_35153/m.59566 type:complete len:248 (-) Transcript_35153:2086-2829(-)